MNANDRAVRQFRESPEWSGLRKQWGRRLSAGTTEVGATADEWIENLQGTLLCLARCVVARSGSPLTSVLPVVQETFFSRNVEFHRSFHRFAARRTEPARRHGDEVDALLVEEALKEQPDIPDHFRNL